MRQGCCSLRRAWIFSLIAIAASAGEDLWLTRLSPVFTSEERKIYRGLASERERAAFREAFWKGKAFSEPEYLARLEYADSAFGSGQLGSGANTDQGRMYLANGAPNSIYRVPSSRIFFPAEIWFYDSLPGTGYRSKLQFLFFKRNNVGDFHLYSPQLHTIRALMIPQAGTRGLFGVNDEITANDIRGRLKTSPAEEEIVEAAIGVARGVTGAENGTILAKAMSPSAMVRSSVRTEVLSSFHPLTPEVRVIRFSVDGYPVIDIQVRTRASRAISLRISRQGETLEESVIPLGYPEPKPVLYTHRFFLPAGEYKLVIDSDGVVASQTLRIDTEPGLRGEAFEEIAGEVKISFTPDARGEIAREAIQRLQAAPSRN